MRKALLIAFTLVMATASAHCHDDLPVFTQELYQQATTGNDPAAQWTVGECYVYGNGVPCDTATALQWFERAAAQDARYMTSIATCYDEGFYLPQDDEQALACYRQAAQRNDFVALWCVGEFYARGRAVPRDTVEALKWFERGAAIDPSYCWALGEYYLEGKFVPRDVERAIQCFEHAAQQEDYLLLVLGERYIEGNGIPQNPKRGFECYLTAAQHGYTPCEWETGECYANGIGVERDPALALQWMERAAGNDSSHMWELGMRLATGNGVEKDTDRAQQWLQRAAQTAPAEQ